MSRDIRDEQRTPEITTGSRRRLVETLATLLALLGPAADVVGVLDAPPPLLAGVGGAVVMGLVLSRRQRWDTPTPVAILGVVAAGAGVGLITDQLTRDTAHAHGPGARAAAPLPAGSPIWAPARPSLRCTASGCAAPDHPVLNTASRGGAVGDERRFMAVLGGPGGVTPKRTLAVRTGHSYVLRAFIADDGAPGTAPARDVRFRIVLSQPTPTTVVATGIVSAANALPRAVSDSVVLTAERPASASVQQDKAVVDSNAGGERPVALDASDWGVPIGYSANTGATLPPCPNALNACRGVWVSTHVFVDAAPQVIAAAGSALTRRPYSPYPDRAGLACQFVAEGGSACPAPADVVLDSLTANPAYGGRRADIGDERAFLDASNTEDTSAGLVAWERAVDVEPGDSIMLRMLVHDDGLTAATGVHAHLQIPTGQVAASRNVVGFLSADRARYNPVNAPIIVRSNTPFTLRYAHGTARLFDAARPDGLRVPDHVIRDGGALLGWDRLDGRLPGGPGHEAYLTAQLIVGT